MSTMPRKKQRSANFSICTRSSLWRTDQYDNIVLAKNNKLSIAIISSAQYEIVFLGTNCMIVMTVIHTPTIVADTGRMCFDKSWTAAT